MRIPLTAREFLKRHATVLDAHYGARVGHTTLKEHARGRRSLSCANANALQAWSLKLDVPAYISAAKTLGVSPDPVAQEVDRIVIVEGPVGDDDGLRSDGVASVMEDIEEKVRGLIGRTVRVVVEVLPEAGGAR